MAVTLPGPDIYFVTVHEDGGRYSYPIEVKTIVDQDISRIPELISSRLIASASLVVPSQSSNAWDACAASAFGIQVVWCNRYGQRPERLPGKPDREIRTLAELPALVRA